MNVETLSLPLAQLTEGDRQRLRLRSSTRVLLNETLLSDTNSTHVNSTLSVDVGNTTVNSNTTDGGVGVGPPEKLHTGCAHELTTTFDDNLGSFGNMFDVYTYGTIQVYGIDIYTDVETSIDYEIYTKLNPFNQDKGTETLAAWTLLTAGTTVGKGMNFPTPIRAFELLTIPPETTMGFFVTLKSPDLRYRDIRADLPDGKIGDIYVKNDDLEIRIGSSVSGYPFTSASFFGRRAWSGTMHYLPEDGCPSAMPSSRPSSIQSSPPSMVSSLMQTMATPSLAPLSNIFEPPSAVPSTSFTSKPTLVAVELVPCTEERTLETTLAGGTGAYGSMFTITSFNSTVTIKSLSFHTDFMERPVTVQVFTKEDDFVGFEDKPEAWTQISKSLVFGAGAGMRTKIPTEDFEAIRMDPNETRAFYITLTTADFRYSRTNATLSQPVRKNEFIAINAGAGLADYPFATKFFIYEPREFNGAVHFDTITECLPTGDVIYAFQVFHTPGMREIDFTRHIDLIVQERMESIFEHDPTIINYANTQKLKLVKTATLVVGTPCRSPIAGYECSPVEISVTLKYDPTARWGEIKYIFLKYYEEVTLSVNMEFKAKYVGNIPVEQGTAFNLGSTSSVLQEMTAEQSAAFEGAILNFLDEPLRKQGVKPLGVKVTGQVVGGASNGDRNSPGRRRQRSSGGSIDISTTITGEYRPPPDIDYDGVVSDALDSNNPDLEKRINRADKYFEVIDSVKTASDKAHRTEPNVTPAGIPTDSSNAKFPIAPVAAGVGGSVALLLLFWCCKRSRRRKEAKEWNQQLNLKSDVLDIGGSTFGGLMGKKKSSQNFGNMFAGDAEITGWAVPSSQHLDETYSKQRRDQKHKDEFADEYVGNYNQGRHPISRQQSHKSSQDFISPLY